MKNNNCERLITPVVVFLMTLLPSAAFAGKESRIELLLDSLDNVLAERPAILSKKQTVLNDLKRGVTDAQSMEALTVKYEQIYQEYLHYNGDSALTYAKKAVQTSKKTKRPEMILIAKFCLLRAYTRQGLLGKAYEAIMDIGKITDILPAYRGQYADILLDFYMRVNNDPELEYIPDIDVVEAWKKYSIYLGKDTPEYEFYKCICSRQGDIKGLKKALSKLRQPSFMSANLYYAIALENRRIKNYDEFYENLILAAINDVQLANTEVSSLLTLLETPLLRKDLKRSYAYIQVCSDNVQRYHDVHRSLQVVKIQARINKEFNDLRNRQITVIVIVAVLFFIALMVSIIETRLLAGRGRKVKKSLDALRVMHSKQMELAKQQQELSNKLKEANSRLVDRVTVYKKDFLNVYHLVSAYISYEKGVRTELVNLLKTNNIRKAIRTLDSSSDVDGQLKLFYKHFDHAFMALYPDFIQRMNGLMKPESRFDESMTELTTSLRIYAFVVLGITDSVGIADFLHLSSQTVYNYRLKMRRSALGDEKKFDDDVINLFASRKE